MPCREWAGGCTATPSALRKSVRRWTTDGPDLKCKVPCQTFNGGWMSRLENRAKPVLTPLFKRRQQRLEAHDLELISYWALKTALILESAAKPSTRTSRQPSTRLCVSARGCLRQPMSGWANVRSPRVRGFTARTVEMDPDDLRARRPRSSTRPLAAGERELAPHRAPYPSRAKASVRAGHEQTPVPDDFRVRRMWLGLRSLARSMRDTPAVSLSSALQRRCSRRV
jgi:hypothetical protein